MFSPEKTILLVIDLQGKLANLMHNKKELFANILTLIQASHHLNIPVIVTEQVPEKIGKTVPEIAQHLNQEAIAKSSFSCCGENSFLEKIESFARKQIVVCGIETHVCVYQTVCDLLDKQYDVQVVGDAVSSRRLENKECAIDRMKAFGAAVTSTEMIVCELLKTAKHDRFKEIMKLIK